MRVPGDVGDWRNLDTGFLNGLRAIAAFTVLTGHCLIWSNWQEGRMPYVPGVGNVAKLAVDLFMLLSGFLMVFNSLERAAKEPMSSPTSWFIFYIRRFFRIAPGYYLSLLCAVVLAGPFLHGYGYLADLLPWPKDFIYNGKMISYTATNLALHATFLFGFFPSWVFSTQLPDWSLSLEMQFYAAFPFLVLAMMRFGVIKVALAAVPVCLLAIMAWHHLFVETSMLLFKLPVFMSGMLLCYAGVAKTPWRRFLLTLTAVALPLTQIPYYYRFSILISLGAAFIAFMTNRLDRDHPFSGVQRFFYAILDNRLMTFGSNISYSVYLFHGFFIAILGSAILSIPEFDIIDRDLRSAAVLLAVLCGTIPTATFVYHFVERPGIELGRAIVTRRFGRTARVPST
jgi:peptidoglycan/LPS O-acetylase OafA/YrhL